MSECAKSDASVHIQAAEAAAVLETQLLRAVAEGTEGLMLKFLDARSGYQPSKRSDSWLKVKKDYCENLRDSLDLVRFCGQSHDWARFATRTLAYYGALLCTQFR